jgi:short-subunit dehydrogenase
MIVTGASSGIGRALAERAVRAGWRVFATGRRAERLEELKRAVHGATGTLETLALELRANGAPARIVRETLQRFERIDVLVNNAGAVAVGAIAAQSDDALREQFETHAIVPLMLTREALPALRHTLGQIFFVGSGVARIPVGGLGAYPPAKAAVRNMARIVRNELRRDGIAVTYVDPGAVATEFMTRAGFAGPSPGIAAAPHEVARRIFDAVETRRSVVNAVPWQTAFVALGELLPQLTDFVLSRAPQIVGTAAITTAQPTTLLAPAESEPAPEVIPSSDSSPSFEEALAPHATRMRKLNLSSTFVASLLVPGRELELGDVALQWAGMPNKNERALTREVLEALADAGFVARNGDERYTAVKSPGEAADPVLNPGEIDEGKDTPS